MKYQMINNAHKRINNKNNIKAANTIHIKHIIGKILLICMLSFSMSAYFILNNAANAYAEIKTIVIIPFEMNSQKDISFIRSGVTEMLNSRLSWKNHVAVIDAKNFKGKTKTSTDPIKNFLKGEYDLTGQRPYKNYNYILTGSITEFAGAFSIDVKVFDLKNKKSQAFFIQAGTMGKIIPGVDILAAEINQKIFKRKTETLEALLNHRNSIESKKERIIRQNPEKLMEEDFGKPVQKDRPFWKFWGKKTDKEAEQDSEKKDKPFWKIW